MKHLMPKLPYAQDALAPAMSEETIQFHYGKHLQAYVDNLNNLLPGSPFEEKNLEEIICNATGPIFNNAAQVWNHTFFFESLAPGGKPMDATFEEKLTDAFGSVDAFREKYLAAAAGLFGSGWAWLVMDDKKKMSIVQESNAGNPLRNGLVPLLTIDVWEHAYYIDCRNRRPEYLQKVWSLIDWEKVQKRYEEHL